MPTLTITFFHSFEKTINAKGLKILVAVHSFFMKMLIRQCVSTPFNVSRATTNFELVAPKKVTFLS